MVHVIFRVVAAFILLGQSALGSAQAASAVAQTLWPQWANPATALAPTHNSASSTPLVLAQHNQLKPAAPPTAPTNPTPTDSATLSRTADITLTWATDGSLCNVHVWGGSIDITSTVGSCTGYHLGAQYGGVYHWQVTAISSTGEITETSSSPVWYFNVQPAAPSALTATSSLVSSPTGNLSNILSSSVRRAASSPNNQPRNAIPGPRAPLAYSNVHLSWEASSDAPGHVDGYNVYFGDGVFIGSANAGVTSYDVLNVLCSSTYTFYVTAVRQGVNSTPSNRLDVITAACRPITPPANPSPAVGATLTRSTDIVLSWATDAISCSVRLTGGNLDITTTLGSCSSYHLGAQYGGSYQWQVTAYNEPLTSTGPLWHFNVRPAEPLTMTAAGSTPTQVDLAWAASTDDPANVDGYKVYFGDGTYLTTLSPGTTRHSVGSLSCNTPYTFYVTTVRQNIESLKSPLAGANTLACPPPSTPSNPTPAMNALLNRTTDVTLVWTTNGNACDVHVWGGSIDITTTATGCLSYHLGTQYGGAYSWQVTAHNPYGVSPGPHWRFNIQPAEPVTISANGISLTEVNVSWVASADEPANVDGYKLYAGNGSLITTMGTGVTSHTVQGLSCSTPYSYYVTTVRQNVESLSSPLASTNTWACPPPTPPASPTPVGGATFTRSADITLAWVTDGSTCDVHVWGDGIAITSTAGSCTGYHLGAQPGGGYTWTVTAHNAYGATPGPEWYFNIQPAPPSGLTAVSPSQSQVNVGWSKSSDDPPNIDAYRIYQGNGTLITTLSAGTTGYIVNGLSCGASYSFYVTALHQGVESPPSNTASAITQNCPLPSMPAYPIPSDGSMLERPSNVILSWTTDGSTCNVHVWGDGIDITSTANSCMGYVLGVQYGGSYQWQVTAHNAYGATTGPIWRFNIQPYGPTGLTGQAVSRTEIALSWVKSLDDPGNIDAYKIAYSNGATITLLNAGSMTYNVSDLSCSTPYTFYISALRQGVESKPSNQVSLSTQSCPPPSSITNLTPSSNTTFSRTNSITLMWTSDGATCDVHVWGSSINITPSLSSCSSYNLGVMYGGVYSWQVTARNAYGVTPGPISLFRVQPAASPRAIVLTSTQYTMMISWTKSADDPANIDSYTVYSGSGSPITLVSAGTNQYLLNGLTCSTSYTFQVRAVRQGVESTSATTNVGNTKPCPPPPPPSNPSPTDGETLTRTANVQLSWSTIASSCDVHVWGGSIDQTINNVSCSGLQLGTLYGGAYQWQVTARNSTGKTTGPTWKFQVQPYTPPTITAQAGGHGQIILSWAKSSDDPANIDSYRIFSGEGTWMDTVPTGTLSYTFNSLTCGTSYAFYVVAARQGVDSIPSDVVAASTLDCSVYIQFIQTADSNLNPKSFFFPGDPIVYIADIFNETVVTKTVFMTWTLSSPNGVYATLPTVLYPYKTPPGHQWWLISDRVPLHGVSGIYTYRYDFNYNGTPSSLSINYRVGAHVYVPLLIKP